MIFSPKVHRPVRIAHRNLRQAGEVKVVMAAEFVHDPGLALMKSGWPGAMVPVVEIDARRIPAPPQDADHRRGSAEPADDCVPVLEVARRLGRRAHAQ